MSKHWGLYCILVTVWIAVLTPVHGRIQPILKMNSWRVLASAWKSKGWTVSSFIISCGGVGRLISTTRNVTKLGQVWNNSTYTSLVSLRFHQTHLANRPKGPKQYVPIGSNMMTYRQTLIFLLGASLLMLDSTLAFLLVPAATNNHFPQSSTLLRSTDVAEGFVRTSNPPSPDWEMDCYSRPVMVGGKKLWEVLLTDSTGSFRYCQTLPSNQVNSKEVRRVVEEVIEESDLKPQTIRFFRGAMFNMINIALSEVEVVAKPSRCTFELAAWLEERHREVYPRMDGYVDLLLVCTKNVVLFRLFVRFRLTWSNQNIR